MVVRNRQIRGDHGEVLALAAAKGYVLVCGPAVAGSVWMSIIYVTSRDQIDAYDLCCCQNPCWCS